MDGVPPLTHLLHRHGKAHGEAPVQVLVGGLSQLVHPGEVPGGLDVVGEVHDLLQKAHISPPRGVPLDGPVDLLIHAEDIPGDLRPGLGVQQLQSLLLQLVQGDVILADEGHLLLHLQLLRAVVKEGRHPGLLHIRPIADGEADSLLLRPQHVGDALVLEVGEGHRPQLLEGQVF